MSAPVVRTPDSAVLRRLEQFGHLSAIASVVWDELVFGCERLADGRRKDELRAYLDQVVLLSFPILAFDEAAATWHGVERARNERSGRPRPYVDGQIAAVARAHDLTLVTSNVRDFTGFDGLAVEDWSGGKKSRR